jgi:hypothetical protein
MFLYNCSIVIRLVQNENVLQLLINLFIFAPISWYNDILRCKPPLIENFIYKMFSNIHHDISKFTGLKNCQIMIIFYLRCNVLSPLGISIQWVQSCLSQQDNGKAKRISNHYLSHVFYSNNMMLSIDHTLHTYLSTLLCVHYAFHRHKNYNKPKNDELNIIWKILF